jgi:hypothetical protein
MTRVPFFVCNLTLGLSGVGDPASSYSTANIALQNAGLHVPHRQDMADTPSGGVVS